MNGGESRILWPPDANPELRTGPEPVLGTGPEPVLGAGPEPVLGAGPEPVGSAHRAPEPSTSPGRHRPARPDLGARARPAASARVDALRTSSGGNAGRRVSRSAKVVVAGGFGAGKTTFVGSVSEIVPLTTEAARTAAAFGVDHAPALRTKKATTVAMDFGRVTIDRSLVLYLFGTPGQERFSFMWDDIVGGSMGAVVLVDTRRLEECYPAIDYFEARSLPFVVGLNRFDGAPAHDLGELRDALAVPADVPLVPVDARRRESAKYVLLALLATLRGRVRVRTPRRSDLARTAPAGAEPGRSSNAPSPARVLAGPPANRRS